MKVTVDGSPVDLDPALARTLEASEARGCGPSRELVVTWQGRRRRVVVTPVPGGLTVWADGRQYEVRRVRADREALSGPDLDEAGSVPFACRLLLVHVAPGDVVEAGTPLFRVESMKMEQEVTAPCRLTVAAVRGAAGSTLARGDRVLDLRPA